jgi:hypothetical protein
MQCHESEQQKLPIYFSQTCLQLATVSFNHGLNCFHPLNINGISEVKYFSFTENHRLLIMRANGSDAGTYRCSASNQYGHSSSSVSIAVEGKKALT